MSFDITSIKVNAAAEVVSADWTYTHANGEALGGTHTFATPPGSVALGTITKATAIGWLAAQIQNTTDEFDAALVAKKAAKDAEAGCTYYGFNDNGTTLNLDGDPATDDL